MNILNKIFGTSNSRKLKKLKRKVAAINALEASLEALSDAELQAKTTEFRERFEAGETLDDLLVEAFAVVREASKRTMHMRHFDMQLVGGMVLNEGSIAEMRTGEGKTLVATLPAYLNGLTGKGVHIVTVNEYLADRDANWMRPLYEFLGLSVGIIKSGQSPAEKKAAYDASITYGTNNEFGFDYLRDNMAFRLDNKMQRELNFAIVDEVDSILIDEARTPLIISGAAEDSSHLYTAINKLIPKLEKGVKAEKSKMEMMDKNYVPEETGHFTVDERTRQVELTEAGHEYVEQLLIEKKLLNEGESLYAATNLSLLHHIHAGLKAHFLFHKDVEYIVQDRRIVLIDEHTGRTMEGRRLSEGLHQALEAKEGLDIQSESQTLASTTFQNYFRLYAKLAGMTGTADTEAFEFSQIYGLNVVVIPTNKPMIRIDANDLIFLTMEEKFEAIVKDITEICESGAPVLVGTASIDTSELLSNFLTKKKIKHEVLNAKFHEREAQIIAQAGRPGVVTIATNMAGRGTDIVLGGKWETEIAELNNPTEAQIAAIKAAWQERHDQVIAAGGLHIIGTERHESRRIDNQLRGRSGRQGDPGESRFYLSLTDDLMRLFNSQAAASLMNRASVPDDQAIESKVVSRAIASAQSQVEGRNAEIRKNILKYDDVMNRQRTAIYADRRQILEGEDISATFHEFLGEVVRDTVNRNLTESSSGSWDLEALWTQLKTIYPIGLEVEEVLQEASSRNKVSTQWLIEEIISDAELAYRKRTDEIGEQLMRELERRVMLSVVDRKWRDHLYEMDYLKEGIGLRAMAQRDPLVEYQREGYVMFQDMMAAIREEAVQFLFNVEIKQNVPDIAQNVPQQLTYSAPSEQGGVKVERPQAQAPARPQQAKPAATAKPNQDKDKPTEGSAFFKR